MTQTYLFATDLGFLEVKADRPLDAIRWLRLHFGYKLRIDYFYTL